MTMRNQPALHDEVTTVVGRTLARSRGTRKVGPARWQIPVSGQPGARMWLDGDWLCAEGQAVPQANDWDRLRRNTTLPTPLKLGRRPDGSTVLCGEIRIDVESAADTARALLVGMRTAFKVRRLERATVADAGSQAAAAVALAEPITRVGWEPIVRGDACVVVVSVREARYEATLGMHEGVHGEIELATLTGVDRSVQEPLAHLLLSLDGRLRGVKACIVDADSAGASRVLLRAQSPGADESSVATVLESLAAACVLFGREVTALAHDVDLAHAYQRIVDVERSNRKPAAARGRVRIVPEPPVRLHSANQENEEVQDEYDTGHDVVAAGS